MCLVISGHSSKLQVQRHRLCESSSQFHEADKSHVAVHVLFQRQPMKASLLEAFANSSLRRMTSMNYLCFGALQAEMCKLLLDESLCSLTKANLITPSMCADTVF